MTAMRIATPLIVPPMMAPVWSMSRDDDAGAPSPSPVEVGLDEVVEELVSLVVLDVVFELVLLLDFDVVVFLVVEDPVGLDPIDVGVDRVTTGSFVSFSDTETNGTADESAATLVATVVARSDAVPHPNWEKPPANMFL